MRKCIIVSHFSHVCHCDAIAIVRTGVSTHGPMTAIFCGFAFDNSTWPTLIISPSQPKSLISRAHAGSCQRRSFFVSCGLLFFVSYASRSFCGSDKESVSGLDVRARSVIRSNSALQSRALGITCVHSENGRLVVRITAAFSARSAITWNRNSAPMSAIGKYPTLSMAIRS